ncbi:hypothetical protein [Melaminivora jejuensis]|nr:hypothetical protein [Melaminivora jejuensis]
MADVAQDDDLVDAARAEAVDLALHRCGLVLELRAGSGAEDTRVL